MDSYFDKIYIINLKSDKTKKEFMENQMKKFRLKNYSFIEAVDGKELDITKLIKEKKWAYPGNNFCLQTCSCKGKGHELNLGNIALVLSHLTIWKDMKEKQYKHCLILEDDCILTDGLLDFNTKIISTIPEDWNLLYLGHSQKIYSHNTTPVNSNFYQLHKGVDETHMYAVSLNCANILINHTYPVRAAIDGYLAHFMINNRIIDKIYICTKQLGLNGSLLGYFKSTLRGAGAGVMRASPPPPPPP